MGNIGSGITDVNTIVETLEKQKSYILYILKHIVDFDLPERRDNITASCRDLAKALNISDTLLNLENECDRNIVRNKKVCFHNISTLHSKVHHIAQFYEAGNCKNDSSIKSIFERLTNLLKKQGRRKIIYMNSLCVLLHMNEGCRMRMFQN